MSIRIISGLILACVIIPAFASANDCRSEAERAALAIRGINNVRVQYSNKGYEILNSKVQAQNDDSLITYKITLASKSADDGSALADVVLNVDVQSWDHVCWVRKVEDSNL